MINDLNVRRRVIATLKAAWLLLVVGFVVWYGVRNWPELRSYRQQLGWWPLLGAFGLLTVARVLLAAISRTGLELCGRTITIGRSLAINSAAQLGKYLPGGIWHFVGRVGLYRKQGLDTRDAGGVILLEHSVLLISGGWLGLLAVLAHIDQRLRPGLGFGAGLAVVATTIALTALSLLISRRLLRTRVDALAATPITKLVGLSIGFWGCAGAAFWWVLPETQRTGGLLVLASGVFAAAWVLGSLVPFAPGGLGVREAVIVALLGPTVGVTSAVGVAAVSRIVWTVNELALALPSTAYLSSPRSASGEREERAVVEGEADARRPNRPPHVD